MTDAEKKIRKLSDNAFSAHVITERSRDGLFRSWRCQKPGTWVYGFDITTIPGSIIITGDIGDMIVTREGDMVPWCRSAVESTGYFAEKVVAGETHEFSIDVFKRWCFEQLADPDIDDDDRETVQSILDQCEDLATDELYRETEDVWQGCDPPDWSEWNPRFLWCRDAIRWFVNHHQEPVTATA